VTDDDPTPVFLATDTEELRTVGNDWLRDADRVTTAQRHVLMASASQYGGTGVLAAAACRFDNRTSYALGALAESVEEVGHHLRGTAEAYDFMDTSASGDLTALGTRLDGAT
jgi:hypothetical protein